MAATPTSAQVQTPNLEVPPLGVGPRLSYLLMLAGILPVAASGIGTFALGKSPMSQWTLMLHVGASPAFAVGLGLVALTWPSRESRYGRITRFLFWILLLAGLTVILSGVLPMTPLFGTEGQHLLYLTHRYGGIVFVGISVLHMLSLRPRR